MSEESIKNMIGKIFNDMAEALETGEFGGKTTIGITILGSELGINNIIKGAEIAQERDSSLEVVLIGPKVKTKLKIYEADTEEEQHKKMEELIDKGEIEGAVTMHYNFPIGVSTVGRIITPSKGKGMYIATTTGTTSSNRIEGMVKNAINGIIVAKAMGLKKPSVGVLNVDGARQVERKLKELKSMGYDIEFAESMRAGGGSIMRGNDLLIGTPDIMLTDSLTGNLLMKIFSSYATGGDYEALGYGYGPGIGEGYKRNILIVSRVSGEPVVANAITFAGELAKGRVANISNEEFAKANKAKLQEILHGIDKEINNGGKDKAEVIAPKKEVVASTIEGIDIMDLEDAVKVLWRNGIYAESGMGCTGPIIMVNEERLKQAEKILLKDEYISE